MEVVYFSNVSNNTARFVQKLDHPAQRIPLLAGDPALRVVNPYILILPTYGGGREGGAVPKQVIRFLNDENNRALIRGVVASGNTNFGATYCLAGRIVAEKCNVRLYYQFELLGDPTDVIAVRYALAIAEEKEQDDTRRRLARRANPFRTRRESGLLRPERDELLLRGQGQANPTA